MPTKEDKSGFVFQAADLVSRAANACRSPMTVFKTRKVQTQATTAIALIEVAKALEDYYDGENPLKQP